MESAGKQGAGRRYSGLAAEERTQARRAAITDAAVNLFGTAGFAATSVKQICSAAGLTERYFYESFRDRQSALAGVYTMLVDDLRAKSETAIANAGGDVAAALRAGLTAFVDYLTSDPRRARIVLIEVIGVSPEIEELRHAVLRRFGDMIASAWAAEPGIDLGSERVRLTTIALSGAVNGLLVDWMMTGMQQSPPLLIDICTDLFLAARP